MTIQEGVNDPSIFKAVFLAGGPGSGKSFIVGKTALTALGFKVINSDDAFEVALKKAGMEATPENIFSKRGQEIRGQAKALTGKKKQLAIDGRLGLVIDGTGKDYPKIKKQASMLKDLGYEVAMIFVNTDLDTAQLRNNMRSRKLPADQVENMWKAVQKNIGKFQNYFGRQMFIIDNSEGSNFESAALSVYRKISQWAKKTPNNSPAKAWIKSQMPNSNVNERIQTDNEYKVDQALKALDRLYKSKGASSSIEGHAFTVSRSYNVGLRPRELAKLYRDKYGVNEEAAPATSIGNASVALPPTMKAKIVVDRRYRKDRPPVLLKRFRKYMEK